VTGGKAFVCLRGIGERVFGGDLDLGPRRVDCVIQMVKLANSRRPIIGNDLDAPPLLWFGLDAVWICDDSIVPNRFDAALERRAVGKRENGIHAIRCETAHRCRNVSVSPVRGHVSTQVTNKGYAVLAGRCGKHPRAAQLRELKGETSDTAGGAVNNDGLTLLDM
jgi:hypothetical protein